MYRNITKTIICSKIIIIVTQTVLVAIKLLNHSTLGHRINRIRRTFVLSMSWFYTRVGYTQSVAGRSGFTKSLKKKRKMYRYVHLTYV